MSHITFSAKNFVFVMDPLSTIQKHTDSSYALMRAAQKRGHFIWFALPTHLVRLGQGLKIRCQKLQIDHENLNPFTILEEHWLNEQEIDVLLMRKDPPFDESYLLFTYLLDGIDPRRTVLVNNPSALRQYNEKLSAMYFPELMPETIATADRLELKAFIQTAKKAIVKPLNRAGGFGIIKLSHDDPNISSVIDLLTNEGRIPIQAQAFLPEVSQGDKRILLLDGEILGAINRVPGPKEVRANMHVGGIAHPATLTERERAIVNTLKPEFIKQGLIFVGLDVIGGKLTEINVTSPTGLQELDRFEGTDPAGKIIERCLRQ